MSTAQINVTLGTAGHIDHGKTALVKALTGCDTDRLKEEKERGMSIDLGYAPCTIADMEVGIVDVPGHENFIKTMVAGAAGMDGVILVVAADDGIMPQTREHLEILTLLGLRHGMVALTKIDRVEPERLPAIRGTLAEFLRGTFLESAPVVGVSNVSGAGFEEFFEALLALVRSIRPKAIDGVFRLPLDRAFSAQGFGTIVAGIPTAGSAGVGDEVLLLPQNVRGQIRRIEVYGRNSSIVRAGQCAAINIGRWEHDQIRRGNVVSLPGYFSAQEWYVCRLRLLPHEKLLLKSGAHVKFHTGTSEVAAAIYPLQGDRLRAGEETLIQVRTQAPIVAGPGDRFIVRTPSPVRTIGGGIIVEGLSRRVKGNRSGANEDLQQRARAVEDDRRFLEYCLRTAENLAEGAAALAQRAKVMPRRAEEMLAELLEQKRALAAAPGLYVHAETAAAASGRVLAAVAAFHRQSPESPGMPREQLRQALPREKAILDGLVAALLREGRLVDRSGRLASAEHRPVFRDEDQHQMEAVEDLVRQAGFQPPGIDQLVASTGTSRAAVERVLRILREHGRLVEVAADLVFHVEAVARGREILEAHFRKQSRLESVEFKYLLDTTRKFALPLLDYFDRVGVTTRVGNTRYLKSHLPPPAARPAPKR